MKKVNSLFLALIISFASFGWGVTGHRTVAKIAQNHLSKKAKKELQEIMGHESLIEASIWMDEIKSDDKYDHTHAWHYVTIPKGETYQTSAHDDKGDAYEAIERMKKVLKDEASSKEEKRDAIRMLTHLVGDFHQPLHVGNGEDRGGNDLKIKWFYNKSNLHRIWDSEIIDTKKLSYSELALMIDHPEDEEPESVRSTDMNVWVKEAMELRPQVYSVGDKDYLSYEYMYKNWETVQQQLYKGGVRLAAILNEIYG